MTYFITPEALAWVRRVAVQENATCKECGHVVSTAGVCQGGVFVPISVKFECQCGHCWWVMPKYNGRP